MLIPKENDGGEKRLFWSTKLNGIFEGVDTVSEAAHEKRYQLTTLRYEHPPS
jgi:hypothetical protein